VDNVFENVDVPSTKVEWVISQLTIKMFVINIIILKNGFKKI